MIDPEAWYPIGRAAKILGVTPRTIHNWRRTGLLTAGSLLKMPSGRYRILGAELLRWLGEPVNTEAIAIHGRTGMIQRQHKRDLKRLGELGC